MNKSFSKLLMLSCLCVLSSCFDIVDETDLNADGSGALMLTANLSKSKSKLATVMLLDSINGYKVPSRKEIEKAMADAADFLTDAEGITNVKRKADFENYIFSISCDFKSVDNIDNIIQEVTKDLKVKPMQISFSFDPNEKVFAKQYSLKPDAKKAYEKLKEEDKKVFTEATYTSIYRFENEVSTYSNTQAMLSKSKKAVMLKASALDVINGKINFTNQIQLK